jgi:hypothetical protein
MCLMNYVICPFIKKIVIVYLDDILIFSATWQDHISHLKHVLDTLKEQLIANLKNCVSRKESLVYLGHIISGGELKVDIMKIEAISK